MSDRNPFIEVYPIVIGVFVPITVPVDCSYYLVKNRDGTNFLQRSDPDDPNTEDAINSESLLGSPAANSAFLRDAKPWRYRKDDILFWAAASTGVGPLVGKFWK